MRRSPSFLPRSFLYVPGNKPELFAKAAAGEADAVILDLEDAVPLDRREEARAAVRTWLLGDAERRAASSDSGPVRQQAARQQQWVRLAPESLAADLRAIAEPGLDGIFLAKCSRAVLRDAAAIVAGLEAEGRLAPGRIQIIGLIEDAASLLDIEALAASGTLTTLAIGEVDLMADLRMARGASTEPALDSIRTSIVIACAAAGLSAPVAPTSTAIRDLDAFEASARKLHDLGFRSRTAVHPSQVPVINRAFTPNTAAVAAAREVLVGFDGGGGGVTVDASGRMIDAAVIRSARETVSRASEF
ncbi:citrate lyase subunit beta/citryl-CoA lyase [Arthrobacter sp. UYP6]|uniref:HpcH/HpaI aldolase/citrate lyase family protein n=1 Tax=Arthrobacter sp. UYP6 TaxID=1756378 RepID=UPI00339685D0